MFILNVYYGFHQRAGKPVRPSDHCQSFIELININAHNRYGAHFYGSRNFEPQPYHTPVIAVADTVTQH